MPYRIVEGRLRLVYVNAAGRTQGSQPDGESPWFPFRFEGRPSIREVERSTVEEDP